MKDLIKRLLPALLCLVTLVALVGPSVSTQTTIANNAADMSGHIVMVADSGTPRTVTNLLADQVDGLDSTRFIWARVVSTATGNQNDFAPGITSGQNTVVVMNNAALATVTGIAGGVDGQRVGFLSINTEVDFAYATSAAGLNSTAANRLLNFATSGPTPILLGYAEFSYDGANSRWRLVSHTQGQGITPTYNAGNYTAAAGTWTVDAGDVAVERFWLVGRSLTFNYNITSTSTSSTPGTVSRVVPGGFTIAALVNQAGSGLDVDNAGTRELGLWIATGNSTAFSLARGNGSNWSISNNNTTVLGSAIFEVQ